ncbi:MAG: pyrimidine/purine nucleoside phosphorylase [Rubritalea sp.]|uniref:pyrimidine/purine nucleoside phosphorylase n=1 Tax=Rubritalea sp. TaxID=2109375 RepID=UPI0032424DE4
MLHSHMASAYKEAMEFKNVTAHAKANIYFDGNVVSHGITLKDGTTKTCGVIFQGSYHFGTEAAERMEIIDGTCKVRLDGSEVVETYVAGQHFDVAADSGFTIEVGDRLAQYICSYIQN